MTVINRNTTPADTGWFGFPSFQTLPMASNPFAAHARFGQAMCAGAMAFNQELARFTSQRLAADAGLFRAISKCASLDEAAAVQSDFTHQAIESYMAEMPKLIEQSARNTANLWAAAAEPDETRPEADART